MNEDYDDAAPKCDRCGVLMTTVLMAAIYPWMHRSR